MSERGVEDQPVDELADALEDLRVELDGSATVVGAERTSSGPDRSKPVD